MNARAAAIAEIAPMTLFKCSTIYILISNFGSKLKSQEFNITFSYFHFTLSSFLSTF